MIASLNGLSLIRSDLFVSQNLLTGMQTLWLARAGTEVGKKWLETNLPSTAFPVSLSPATLGNGTYAVTIESLGNGKYRLTAVGTGPSETRRVVEEVMRLPDFAPAGAITSTGDGLHADFNDESGGIGRRIPDFTVDARNHAPDGTLSALCPSLSPFAAVQTGAQSDLTNVANTLRQEIVTRANSFCLPDGNNNAGSCTPGLFWVRGAGVTPRFQTAACLASDPTCFLNLDLADAALRAIANPPAAHLPPAPDNRGPLAADPATTPLALTLSAAEAARLQVAVQDILHGIDELPDERVVRLSTSLGFGHHQYGSLEHPAVVRVEEGVGPLDIDGGATVDGVGVLLIPRVVQLGDATFNWKGIIVLTGAGDLQAAAPSLCGQVLGAVIVDDDAALDRKLDFDLVQRGSYPPFAINYSCEAVTRTLTTLLHTVSWVEKYGD
ncbi:MAG: hypothetical protein HYZ50_12175 [Deltaproteobacteria bacterium]|nr:hypothetical protein [Deltaproteobacteria bacterium]